MSLKAKIRADARKTVIRDFHEQFRGFISTVEERADPQWDGWVIAAAEELREALSSAHYIAVEKALKAKQVYAMERRADPEVAVEDPADLGVILDFAAGLAEFEHLECDVIGGVALEAVADVLLRLGEAEARRHGYENLSAVYDAHPARSPYSTVTTLNEFCARQTHAYESMAHASLAAEFNSDEVVESSWDE